MKYCRTCLNSETRPRIQFNSEGVCNACEWHERKQTVVDWSERWKWLVNLCDEYRRLSGFDCIVPCSGGKDSSYVAWKLKHELGMHPLCITFQPQLQTRIGRASLDNFIQTGFDHILITPDPQIYRQYARDFFVSRGMPKQPFVVGISTALLRLASLMDIRLIVYGEQGEVEYGGKQDTETLHKFDRSFLKEIYFEGQDPTEYGPWWPLPSQDELDKLVATWWSIYEDWDPEKHAKLAKDKMGFQVLTGGSIGTFTNYAQLDDVLQDLHAFLLFVKFGFGRCTSDACIEIRRGRLSRDEGVKIVNEIDGQFPVEYLDAYLDYFDMSPQDFWMVVDSFVDYDILESTGQLERPYKLKELVH